MKKRNLSIIIVSIGLTTSFGYGCGFGPDYDKAEIKQNVGGTLICNSVYNADQHSWTYDVSYTYKTSNDSIIDMGSGTYYGREWNKDEQVIKFNDWLILKTGGFIGTDKVIVTNVKTKKKIEYEFTPEKIEQDSIWRSLKTKSLLHWCCPETFIDRIHSGLIQVHYKFRVNETNTNKYDRHEIFYKINDTTGEPVLIKIQ
jgi:hypothetical protein